jgi:hypothetical protein
VIEVADAPERYEDLFKLAADTSVREAALAEAGETGTVDSMDEAETDKAGPDEAAPPDDVTQTDDGSQTNGLVQPDDVVQPDDGPQRTEPPVARDTVRPSPELAILHQTGSRAGQIDRFPLDTTDELTMGRDPACAIVFDAQRDNTVSRRHAVIRITHGDPISFAIQDLGSLNGTMLNGERIDAETGLLPDDRVRMGLTGPSFVFDVEPRPPHVVAMNRRLSRA